MADARQAQLEKLEAAYYSGVLKVREGDTWVEYQTATQMKGAIDDLRRQITSSKIPRGTRFVSLSSKGYY